MQRPPLQNKSIGETSAQGSGGPEPMELGMAQEEDIDARRNTEVAHRKRLLLLSQAKRRACCTGLPTEKEARGKRDGSLVLTVGANEAEKEDGEQKSAVQRDSEYVGQLLTEAAAVEKQKKEPVDTGVQVTEETEPVVKMYENESADEEIPAECILLSIEGVFF